MIDPAGARVLVIDDSGACRAVLARILRDAGFVVHEAEDGQRGAELALTGRFDAIVVDHWMDEMTGTQLCRLLSADARTASVPIVVLTASASRRGLFWAIESGASAYLSKDDLARLPALLAQLHKSPRSTRSGPMHATHHRSVLGRLGDLFDGALLGCVVRKRVQGIASMETTMHGAVERVSSLLASLIEFRWLAIELHGDRSGTWLMAHGLDARAEGEALDVLAPRQHRVLERFDDDRCVRDCAREERLILALEFGVETVGTLAVSLDASHACAESARLIEQIASEFASVVKLVSLLEVATRAALSDELTGVPNRRAARDFLRKTASIAERNGQPLAIAMVDIDHFKRVNDTLGHDAGDGVLRTVAAALLGEVRESDLLARWGGEEFLLVFPQTSLEGATVVCERVRAAIAAMRVSSGQSELRMSVSIGVSALDRDGVDAMIRRADEALYAAKERGRDRVIVDRALLQRIA